MSLKTVREISLEQHPRSVSFPQPPHLQAGMDTPDLQHAGFPSGGTGRPFLQRPPGGPPASVPLLATFQPQATGSPPRAVLDPALDPVASLVLECLAFRVSALASAQQTLPLLVFARFLHTGDALERSISSMATAFNSVGPISDAASPFESAGYQPSAEFD
jgi:hypothetical protein